MCDGNTCKLSKTFLETSFADNLNKAREIHLARYSTKLSVSLTE